MDRPRRAGAGGCWRRRGCATRRCAGRCRRRSKSSISERQPIGIGRIGEQTVSGRRARRRHRRVRAAVRRSRSADHRRPRDAGRRRHGGGPTTRAELAARVIARSRTKPELAQRLSQIDVSDLHNAAVILSGDPAVIYARRRPVPRAAAVVSRLAPALRERVADIDYVDLRFDDRIYVRPAGRRRRPRKLRRRRRRRPVDRRSDEAAVTRRQSGAKRTVSGRARRRHVEGDGRRRRDARRRRASTSSASASPSRAASAAASSSTSRPRSTRSRRRSRKPS